MEELWALGVFLREMQGCVNSWTIDYLRGNPALAPRF